MIVKILGPIVIKPMDSYVLTNNSYSSFKLDDKSYFCQSIFKEIEKCIKYNDRERDKYYHGFSKLDIGKNFDIKQCNNYEAFIKTYPINVVDQSTKQVPQICGRTSFIVNLKSNNDVTIRYEI